MILYQNDGIYVNSFLPKKNAPYRSTERFIVRYQLHSTGDLAGTEAAGAHIDVLGSTVNHSLNALDVGLPGTVGAAVRVRHLNAEHNALITKFTFGHSLDLLAVSNLLKARLT